MMAREARNARVRFRKMPFLLLLEKSDVFCFE